ncbi:hypothetical protein JOD45_001549 [Scopulibacillus daqui]|uniref:Uncharacterized protein n=1 Tax=Scopulibacillus daqui TaxID=1469162 RepID=A0ABS2PZG7_9BACL|nr:hypothetical protein [Scopulibacillus daqui]
MISTFTSPAKKGFLLYDVEKTLGGGFLYTN